MGADTTPYTGQTLTLTIPPMPVSQYRWQDSSAQNTYSVKQQGQYSIRVMQANCVATDTIQVCYIQPALPDLGPDKGVCGAEKFTIKPVVAEGKFSWQDGFANTLGTVVTAGVYWASARNDCATVSIPLK